MNPNQLHVFAARSNPLGWEKPDLNWDKFAAHMLRSGVSLTVIECAYGEQAFRCNRLDGVRHIGVRARTRGWIKENLLNIGIRRCDEARYIAWVDADVMFRRPDWAQATLDALQHYDIVQPWSDCLDLGPGGDPMAWHKSFAAQYFQRKPVVATGHAMWRFDGGPYEYPHSGYAWAMRRDAYDRIGGLFDVGGMGSGDHHMALALVGAADASLPSGANAAYRAHVKRWEARALRHINRNLGVVDGTIEHLFHGRKQDRSYNGRWDMFLKHDFNPDEDLVMNSYGVFEFAPDKPELRHDFDLYLHSRNEDVNSLA